METDSIRRFWDKYIEKTMAYNVPKNSTRWYVKHVELYIKSLPSRRLAQHSSNDLDQYLKDLGRNKRLADWTFRQAIEALQILFVDIVSPPWAASFPWEFWINSASQLPHSHTTLARDYSRTNVSNESTTNSFDKDSIDKARITYPEYFDKLITKIRCKHYSIPKAFEI